MTRDYSIPEDFDVNFIRFEDTGEEELTGENCPICGYPIVVEDGLELCYRCGWYRGMEEDESWL